jgi:endoglucanase
MKSLQVLLCVFLFCLGSALLHAQTAPSPAGVPISRLNHLRHGVNLSHWFAQVYDSRGLTDEHFKNWVTDDDLALIKRLGFDHVRVGVDPKPMFVFKQAEKIPAEKLRALDEAIERILKHDLGVILTLQPDDDFQSSLTANNDMAEQFADFWRGLAKHYACNDVHAWCNPELVFFEVLNEPNLDDPYRWSGIQAKLVAAIRDSAPNHTILATGGQRSNIDGLLFLEPVHDRNVIYSFHYYDPFFFTHQGATWSTNFLHRVANLSFPSSPDSANRVAEDIPDALNKLYIVRYGQENWNGGRIASDIAQVRLWAKHYNVSVMCDEFGVHRKANGPDRVEWIKDVRNALAPDIRWTVWDYSDTFGVITKENGKTTPDNNVLNALGLP